MMLVTAPISWVHMARVVRPVDCSSRSKQNWLNIPMERPRQTVAYWVPYSTMTSFLVWARKKGRDKNNPMRANTAKLHRARKMPVLAAWSAISWRFSPKDRESSALMPTAVPPPTAIIRFCSGKARDTAFRASWLSWATNTLSTTL